MGKKIDPDVKAIRDASRALMGSTSQRMLRANMEYLWDLFIDHPPSGMPPHPSAQQGHEADVPSFAEYEHHIDN